MDTLFISDIHLSEERPEKLDLLKQLLRCADGKVSALYILGDLVENFWLGNDDQTPPNPAILSELRDYTAKGNPLFIVRGNRDLMLDSGIELLTGAKLLADLSVIELDGKLILITHGDVLCTRDVNYQRYRKFMESKLIKWTFLHLPYGWREGIVRRLSPAFKQSTRNKKPEIMDVDADAVTHSMREYGVDEIIHGHTHRPDIHDFMIDNKPAKRIVLGDWYNNELILVCRGKERKLLSVQDYINSIGSD